MTSRAGLQPLSSLTRPRLAFALAETVPALAGGAEDGGLPPAGRGEASLVDYMSHAPTRSAREPRGTERGADLLRGYFASCVTGPYEGCLRANTSVPFGLVASRPSRGLCLMRRSMP